MDHSLGVQFFGSTELRWPTTKRQGGDKVHGIGGRMPKQLLVAYEGEVWVEFVGWSFLQVLHHAGHQRSQRLKSYGNWANRSCFRMVVDQEKSAVGGVVLATGEKSWCVADVKVSDCWKIWNTMDLKTFTVFSVHHKLMSVSKEPKKTLVYFNTF